MTGKRTSPTTYHEKWGTKITRRNTIAIVGNDRIIVTIGDKIRPNVSKYPPKVPKVTPSTKETDIDINKFKSVLPKAS